MLAGLTFSQIFLYCIIATAYLAWICVADTFEVGIGASDATGLCGAIQMMGFADISQSATGIHMRLKARVFIICDGEGRRIALVVVDAAMLSYYVKRNVLRRIADILGPNIYTDQNVCFSATHTHASPGGDMDYMVYQLAHTGFHAEKAANTIDGITLAIIRAHRAIRPAHIHYGTGQVHQVAINRSPKAYQENPRVERELCASEVDAIMHVFKFTESSPSNGKLKQTLDGESGKVNPEQGDRGLLCLFAVHPTSLNNTNHLISGDNRGIAAGILERHATSLPFLTTINNLTKDEGFVVAFPLAPSGDVSPNTEGAFCLDSGAECLEEPQICPGGITQCHGRGPAYESGCLASARIIGQRIAAGAQTIYQNNTKDQLNGLVDYRAANVNMTALIIPMAKLSLPVTLCLPALGYGFGGGTIDGPGLSAFHQGDTLPKHTLWDILRDLLRQPSPTQAQCQSPKPILIAGGELHVPYSWLPEILSFQVLRLGRSHFLLTCPAEVTTMAGRRIRSAIQTKIKNLLKTRDEHNEMQEEEVTVLLLTICNGYASYLTTPEEYTAQRYEGASTLYGTHSLAAFIHIFDELVTAMLENRQVANLPIEPIPDESPHFLEFSRPVRPDQRPFFGAYGRCLQNVHPRYNIGDTVKVIFQGVHPANNFAHIPSFILIERQAEDSSGTWELMYDDFDDCTLFEWRYNSFIWRTSEISISWIVPAQCPLGTYRIRYNGFKRNPNETFTLVNGTSNPFKVA